MKKQELVDKILANVVPKDKNVEVEASTSALKSIHGAGTFGSGIVTCSEKAILAEPIRDVAQATSSGSESTSKSVNSATFTPTISFKVDKSTTRKVSEIEATSVPRHETGISIGLRSLSSVQQSTSIEDRSQSVLPNENENNNIESSSKILSLPTASQIKPSQSTPTPSKPKQTKPSSKRKAKEITEVETNDTTVHKKRKRKVVNKKSLVGDGTVSAGFFFLHELFFHD